MSLYPASLVSLASYQGPREPGFPKSSLQLTLWDSSGYPLRLRSEFPRLSPFLTPWISRVSLSLMPWIFPACPLPRRSGFFRISPFLMTCVSQEIPFPCKSLGFPHDIPFTDDQGFTPIYLSLEPLVS